MIFGVTIWEIIWTGGLPHLSGSSHLPRVPHLHVTSLCVKPSLPHVYSLCFLFTRSIRKYSTRRKEPFEEDGHIQVNKKVLFNFLNVQATCTYIITLYESCISYRTSLRNSGIHQSFYNRVNNMREKFSWGISVLGKNFFPTKQHADENNEKVL